MEECQLPYIPNRLKTNDKPVINYFEVGEFLYRRCTPDELENPYKKISVAELSHNRSGLNGNILCNANDVLYSIRQDENFQEYEGKIVCTLAIISLNDDSRYRKMYLQTKNNINYEGIIELLHEPEPCMYPHCVFRVWINNTVITMDNYKETLNKLPEIKTRLKEELASMIWSKQVSQNDNA